MEIMCAAGCGRPALVQWLRQNPLNGDDLDAVYSCAVDVVSADRAGLIHQDFCAAPAAACNCVPFPFPTPPAPPVAPQLPPGW
jgi:hypothetical protein